MIVQELSGDLAARARPEIITEIRRLCKINGATVEVSKAPYVQFFGGTSLSFACEGHLYNERSHEYARIL